jgi:hypothetical protein
VSNQSDLSQEKIDDATRSLVRASEVFDEHWYLKHYPDARSWDSPLDHFLTKGWKLGYDPGPGFSITAYLEANPDVAEAGVNPLIHWLRHGKKEGRLVCPSALVAPRTAAPSHLTKSSGLRPDKISGSETFGRAVLVYQMAKVGSRSAEAAIRSAFSKAGIVDPVLHVHNLARIEQLREEVKQRYPNPDDALRSLSNAEKIKAVIRNNPSAFIDIVTLVREPVARAVSSFFHRLDWYLPHWQKQHAEGRLRIEHLTEMFLEHERPWEADWFELELKQTFAIDVYQQPFDHNRGWQVYRRTDGQLRCLLIRTEDLRRQGKTALEQFFGIPFGEIESVNTGEEKPQGALYKPFQEAGLPEYFVEKCYSTKLARHFYTQEELDAFKRKWTKRDHW